MLNMLGKMAKIQKRMSDMQRQVGNLEATGESGGGMVKVVATGDQRVKSITIEQVLLDTGDLEMLQDLVAAGVNQALDAAAEAARQKMQEVLGDMAPPGMDLGGLVQ